jgi:hypothetical protein
MRQDIKDSLRRYVEQGIAPGGFLLAVLSNNLMEAIGRADEYNLQSLRAICGHVYCKLPAGCHGSELKVNEWLKKFNEPGEK